MATRPDFWQLLRGAGADLEATIAGTSMVPTLPHATRVLIRPSSSQAYRVGDVVVCVLKDELYAHRVVRRGRAGKRTVLVTIGDNRRLCDPPACASDVLGSVEARWQGAGWQSLPPPPPRTHAWRLAVAANAWLLTTCARLHYGMARRVQGTLLQIARLPLRMRSH